MTLCCLNQCLTLIVSFIELVYDVYYKMWSTFSSLYSELPRDLGTSLTEYVRFVRIGKFAAAEEVFTSFSAEDRKVPLLCIEKALGLLYQGRNAAVRAFIDEILANQELKPDQRWLLLMVYRFATIMARGAMFPALFKARELRDKLMSVAWKDFSLYQVIH